MKVKTKLLIIHDSMKSYFLSTSYKRYFLFLLIAIAFTFCKKDPYKGWTYYTESPPPPEIMHMRSIVSNCVPPYPVTFSQLTYNLIGNVNYFWNFGDGNTSTNQNPHHIYPVPGNYTVMLVVSNEIGADTAYLEMTELAQPTIPVAASFTFTRFNNNAYAPNKVMFVNSSNGANQFYWHFGDGGENNNANPEHVFQNPGNYTVKLKGTCTNGDYDETTSNIVIMPPPQRVFIDSINLMLPSAYKNKSVFIDMYHNTTLIGSTYIKSPSSYPVKLKKTTDFPAGCYFDNVQFSNNEIFEFIIQQDLSPNPPAFLYKIVLAPVDIQNNFYPRKYYNIKPVPAYTDVFIDLYLNY